MALAVMQLFSLFTSLPDTRRVAMAILQFFVYPQLFFCSFPTISATNIMTAKQFFAVKSYFYIKVCIFAYTKKQKG
jgi:hypothetical protein